MDFSGMNLQICFMNETSSDTESPSSESAPPTTSQISAPVKSNKSPPEPPKSLNLPNVVSKLYKWNKCY